MTTAPAIPDHEMLHVIGEGSYGEVWLARNAVGTRRAVKVIRRERFDSARPFDREFTGLQKYEPLSRSHEGLVDVLQLGRNDAAGYFYYIMELADDAAADGAADASAYRPLTLRKAIDLAGRLAPEECVRFFIALAGALDHLHRHGLIHRDVKPSNIIFVDGVAKLADIGLVAEMSESRSYVGTEGYIPPEGPGSGAADIFSLGKVLYESFTGQDRLNYPSLPQALALARAECLSPRMGRRFRALDAIAGVAAEHHGNAELRNAAITALALPDARPIGWRPAGSRVDTSMRRLAVPDKNGALRLYTLGRTAEEDRLEGELPGSAGCRLAGPFSPDGGRLAAFMQDRSLVVWDTERRTIVRRIPPEITEHSYQRCEFTRDGGALLLMQPGGLLVHPLDGTEPEMIALPFSPDTMSGSADGGRIALAARHGRRAVVVDVPQRRIV